MASISTSGLISGIDTDSLITKLIALDSAPVTQLQNRIKTDDNLTTTYKALAGQLQLLQTTALNLEKPQTFGDTKATSSDESVLTATASAGAATGSYSVRVARTVTTQQLVSGGFADASAKVGAGTITVEQGTGSNLARPTPLADLNGGAGIARGSFRITDRSGATAVIDTGSAVSLDDVVNQINSATTVGVRAAVKGDHLLLTDTTGKTASNLIVQDLGTGTSAAGLGIAGTVAAVTLTGTKLNTVGRATLLSSLNDGRGVTLGTGGATGDFTVHRRNGTTFNVNLATATTVGGAVDAINAAAGFTIATLTAGGSGLTLTDSGSGGTTFAVTANNGSHAAADLGLTAAASGGTITGKPVVAGLDTTLLSSLKGGAGVTLGTLQVTDAAGAAHNVNLAAATDVQGVIDALNTGSGGKYTASLKPSGNGIQLTDTSGGTGALSVTASTTATALGLAGSATNGTLAGGGLHKQWLTGSTLLSSLNGGQGVGAGSFTVTTAAGAAATITVDDTVKTVGQLLYRINSKGLAGLTASVNANGNGIAINDASGGGGKLTVTDVTGSAAADLNVKGTAATTGNATIDGAFVKAVTVDANDTVASVQTKLNAADAGITATTISDGSAAAPTRLSLTADHTGTAGAVVFDAGTTGLNTLTLVGATDAAVFVGGSSAVGTAAAQPLLVTSSTDTVNNVIAGVSLNLNGVGTDPVQLTVSADPTDLVTALGQFTTTFNSLTTTIGGLSTFNTSSNTAGQLLGDPVALSITTNLFTMLDTTVPGNGQYPSMYSVGFGVAADNQLTFDEDKFRAALADDPAAVQALFNATATSTNAGGTTTTAKTGVAYAIDRVLTKLVDPVTGTVTTAQKELTAEVDSFNDRITQLNALLDQKKVVYQTQFAAMELALAKLQSQSSYLGQISSLSSSTKSSSSS